MAAALLLGTHNSNSCVPGKKLFSNSFPFTSSSSINTKGTCSHSDDKAMKPLNSNDKG